MKINKLIIALSAFLSVFSCTDDLDTEPSDSLYPDQVLTDLKATSQLASSMYNTMQDDDYYGAFIYYHGDVKADYIQTTRIGARTETEYLYRTEPETAQYDFYTQAYNVITTANIIIANIDNLQVTEAEKETRDQIKAEAYAMRGIAHFDLVKVFGKQYMIDNGASLGVPLITTVQALNDKPTRNTVAEVYSQVIIDLEKSIMLFPASDDYSRINLYGAKAFLSRVYLYKGEYAKSLAMAEDVINNSGRTLVSNAEYINMWKSLENTESLFYIANSTEDNPGREGIGYLLNPAAGIFVDGVELSGYEAICATDDFINLIQSDVNDVRNGLLKEGNYSPFGVVIKYQGRNISTDRGAYANNTSVTRLSEVYLNAAEAAFQLGDTGAALTYLNAIVERANPSGTLSSVTLDRILEERAKELILEGHRFYDALRNNIIIKREGGHHLPGVLTPIDNTMYRTVMPIPQDEINRNPNIKQNTGY